MFKMFKTVTPDMVRIAQLVAANTFESHKAVDTIVKSNGQIPAAIRGLPYRKQKLLTF